MKNSFLVRIYHLKEKRKKGIAILIDPDKTTVTQCEKLIKVCGTDYQPDFFLVGGSFVSENRIDQISEYLSNHTNIPVVLFPGNSSQLSNKVDAILFLSLISGRNPDLLIGQHVIAAPILKKNNIEVVSTGYMLFENKNLTTAVYISNTLPLPANKPEIAVATALAGEYLGLKILFLDAGSGADSMICSETISSVSENTSIPLIVGGGIKTLENAKKVLKSGADIIVIGNHFEEKIGEIPDFVHIVRNFSES